MYLASWYSYPMICPQDSDIPTWQVYSAGLISSSVFAESYLQNRIIDKRLSLPPIWAYISVSVFYTIVYIEEKKPTHTQQQKKRRKKEI